LIRAAREWCKRSPRVPFALGVALLCTVICLWLTFRLRRQRRKKLRSTIFDLATRNPIALFGSDQVIGSVSWAQNLCWEKGGNKLENITVFE